jgi:hypothetical protein
MKSIAIEVDEDDVEFVQTPSLLTPETTYREKEIRRPQQLQL